MVANNAGGNLDNVPVIKPLHIPEKDDFIFNLKDY